MTKNTSDNFKMIVNCVCKHYFIDPSELSVNRRHQDIVQVRQTIWAVSRELLGARITLSAIGRMVGNRGHATVIAGIKVVNDQREVNNEFDKKFTEILEHCRSLLIVRHQSEDIPIKARLAEILRYNTKHNMKIALREIISTI